MHTLVAMRYSHARTSGPPSKLSRLRHARRTVSWTGVLRLVEQGEHPVTVDVEFAPVPLRERLERRIRERPAHRPDVFCRTSCTAQVLPSGSLKKTNEP